MIYNWQVTNLFTLDEAVETNYVVTALYEVVGVETVSGTEYYRLIYNQHNLK
jgi:hypothetical protein